MGTLAVFDEADQKGRMGQGVEGPGSSLSSAYLSFASTPDVIQANTSTLGLGLCVPILSSLVIYNY
jgi:hypothetical protein